MSALVVDRIQIYDFHDAAPSSAPSLEHVETVGIRMVWVGGKKKPSSLPGPPESSRALAAYMSLPSDDSIRDKSVSVLLQETRSGCMFCMLDWFFCYILW